MKICMLVRHHSFRDVRIFEKMSKSLVKMGHELVVIAGRRSGKLFDISGEPIENRKLQKNNFKYNGIRFVTFETNYPYSGDKFYNRMILNLKSNKRVYFQDELYQKAMEEHADVYIAHTLDVLYEAVQIKKTFRGLAREVKVIFDAKELEDNTRFMNAVMNEVDHTMTVSESIATIYKKIYPRVPISLIYNSPHYIHRLPRKNFQAKNLVIAYEGELTNEKGNPQMIVNTMGRLQNSGVPAQFMVLGGLYTGNTNSKAMKQMYDHPRIHMMGWVRYHKLPYFYRKVHMGYINFKLNVPNRYYALPNKFFSYLNSGIPVIVNAASDMKKIIQTHQCGIVLNKKNATSKDYARELVRISKNRALLLKLSQNARKAMSQVYSWDKMEIRLQKMMDSLN